MAFILIISHLKQALAYEMLFKEKVLETIWSLPDKFFLDELVERLILLEKISTGLQEVEEGKVVSQEEAKESKSQVHILTVRPSSFPLGEVPIEGAD